MLVRLRARKVRSGHVAKAEQLAFRGYKMIFSHHRRYRLAIKTGRVLQETMAQNGYIQSGFGPLAGWTESRYAPTLKEEPFRDKWEALSKTLKTKS